MRHIKFISSGFFFLILTLLFSSCEKEEGTGGMASISGTVYNTDFSPGFTNIIDAYNMPETDVYIVYGDDPTYGDNVNTNYDGSFCFNYLRAGDYTIYVYSEDSSISSTSDKIAVSMEICIGKKENKNIGILNTVSVLDYDDGFASISGKVYKINYNGSYTSVNEAYYSPDEDVYIIYEDELSYFDKTKTRADGSYSFSNLIKGEYRIFVFSEDPSQTSVSNTIEISKDTVVSAHNQHIVLPDLIVAD